MRTLWMLFFLLVLMTSCLLFASESNVVPTVLVTAKKLSQVSGAQSTITHEDIITNGAATLSQALQTLGGVQLQNTVGNDSQVALSLRGFGVNASSNTLLLVNGIPVSYPDLMPADLNIIPPQEIELIEVIAGSETVLYGDQAVAGVINVVTRKQTTEPFSLSCNAGSYNQRACYLAVNNSATPIRFGMNIQSSHTDNYRDNNDYDQDRLSGAVHYSYTTGALGVDYQVAQERMGYPGGLTAEQVAQNRRQAANDSDFFRDVNGYVQLSHEQKLGTHWRLETDLVHRGMSGNGILNIPFQQSRATNFIRPQLKGALGKALLTAGIDYNQDHYYLKSLFGRTNDQQNKYGLFSVLDYPLLKKFILSVGARGAEMRNQLASTTTNHTLNRAVATTLGLQYRFSDHANIYVRRAGNYRFPKADEEASTTSEQPLKIQRGVSYETGAKWTWHQWTNQIGIYQLNLRDEITFDPLQTVEQPFGSNRNLAPTMRRGFSFSELYRANEQLSLSGQYNFVYARFQSGANEGNRIPLVSEITAHLGVDYHFLPNWNFYTEALYTGNQYPANDDANVLGKIGGYMTYNFNLRYVIKNISASFRMNNIFNKYYYFYTVFQPGMGEFFYPAPGRNFMLMVKYVFN